MKYEEKKQLIDDLRVEWKSLWKNRIDDRVRAEGIAKRDYLKLLVDKGTVIIATRDYRPLDFFDIVENYLGFESGKATVPNPTIGGWGKFVRNNIKKQKIESRKNQVQKTTCKKIQQQKKGGRGWVHTKLSN